MVGRLGQQLVKGVHYWENPSAVAMVGSCCSPSPPRRDCLSTPTQLFLYFLLTLRIKCVLYAMIRTSTHIVLPGKGLTNPRCSLPEVKHRKCTASMSPPPMYVSPREDGKCILDECGYGFSDEGAISRTVDGSEM